MGEILQFRKSRPSHLPESSLVNFRPESKMPSSTTPPYEGKIIDKTVFEAKRDDFRSDIYHLTPEDFPLIDVASPLSWETPE